MFAPTAEHLFLCIFVFRTLQLLGENVRTNIEWKGNSMNESDYVATYWYLHIYLPLYVWSWPSTHSFHFHTHINWLPFICRSFCPLQFVPNWFPTLGIYWFSKVFETLLLPLISFVQSGLKETKGRSINEPLAVCGRVWKDSFVGNFVWRLKALKLRVTLWLWV